MLKSATIFSLKLMIFEFFNQIEKLLKHQWIRINGFCTKVQSVVLLMTVISHSRDQKLCLGLGDSSYQRAGKWDKVHKTNF